MELKVWVGSVQRVISGVSDKTTSHDVIVALAQATGQLGRFILVEKWRNYEKNLSPNECPLLVAQTFGDYSQEVQFILKPSGETTGQSRRLAEAKSPKPQRRRTAIRKSISFSGGAHSVGPSRSPRLQPLDSGIAEEDSFSDSNYGTPQPRRPPPQPHPADSPTFAANIVASRDVQKTSLGSGGCEETRQTGRLSSSSSQSAQGSTRTRKSKSSERSADKRESQARAEARRQREAADLRARELAELQQTIANHERRLEEEKRKLHNIERDITTVTVEEEHKWGRLYDCRDEISKALLTVQHLDAQLDDFDEVLLSEEINVLLLRQKEMAGEMADIQQQVDEYDSHLTKRRQESESLTQQLGNISRTNEQLDSVVGENEEEMLKLQKKVDEKKRFLLEAEDGYMSACDDLKEADISLDKRRQMLIELERELREYNLQSFINTGFSEKLAETNLGV